MPFFCPVCKRELRADYLAKTPIAVFQHGGDQRCEGIGQQAVFGHVESKNQRKNKARVAGSAASAQHKEQKSVSNLNAYQTQHKNSTIQKAREEKAKDLGLRGHSSADSNAKKNRGTADGLNQINK